MAQFLRQSTAVDIRLGPFVDVSDGFTPETGVTIAASDEKAVLKAGGAATVTMAGAFAAVTGADGWYDYTASTGDLDTLGDVTFVMQDDDVYLPVFARFQIVEEEVYDDMFAASAVGYLKPTTAGRDLNVSAGNAVVLVDTCTTNTDVRGTDSALLASSAPTNFGDLAITVTTGEVQVGGINASAVTATSIATDAITAAKIAAGAITSSEAPNLDVAVSTRLAPTVAARTLDVTVGGEAGLDLDNTIGTIAAAQIATDAITAAKLASDVADEIRDAVLPLTNTSLSNIEFLWVAASDHVTPVTGASTTSVTRSIDGGAFGAAGGTLAEVGNGIYQFDASAADMNGGIITLRFVATGGTPGAPDDAFVTIVTSAGV